MRNQFNFLSQPLLSTLRDAANLLPSLDKVDLLWYNATEGRIKHQRVKHTDKDNIKDLKLSSQEQSNIKEFRKKLKGTQWYSILELPFHIEKEEETQEGIFNEIQKSVLCIGFLNQHDLAYNVYIFYFREDSSDFGPVRNDEVLETSQKRVIERILNSSLKAILNSYQENRKAMIDFNHQLRGMLEMRQRKIEQQQEQVEQLELAIDSVLNSLINKFKAEGELIVISQEAKELLRPHLSQLDLLSEHIYQAILFARALHFGSATEQMTLQVDYFSQLESMVVEQVQTKEVKADPYAVDTKIYRFLDDLERAAEELHSQGIKLTSAKVGGALQQPITAAAISDKLKNHSKKVNLLLRQYPHQWQMIRYKFRPIVNVQERAVESRVA